MLLKMAFGNCVSLDSLLRRCFSQGSDLRPKDDIIKKNQRTFQKLKVPQISLTKRLVKVVKRIYILAADVSAESKDLRRSTWVVPGEIRVVTTFIDSAQLCSSPSFLLGGSGTSSFLSTVSQQVSGRAELGLSTPDAVCFFLHVTVLQLHHGQLKIIFKYSLDVFLKIKL